MNKSTFLLIMLLGLTAHETAASCMAAATGMHCTVHMPDETTGAITAFQETPISNEEASPWSLSLIRASVILGVVLALLLFVVFVRSRAGAAGAADTHVEVTDYLDPRRKIRVPRTELREPVDDRFYALYLGRITFVVKIYWRHVHF